MQTATFVVSCASLVVSSATLVALVIGGRKVKSEVDSTKSVAEEKINRLRAALMEL